MLDWVVGGQLLLQTLKGDTKHFRDIYNMGAFYIALVVGLAALVTADEMTYNGMFTGRLKVRPFVHQENNLISLLIRLIL